MRPETVTRILTAYWLFQFLLVILFLKLVLAIALLRGKSIKVAIFSVIIVTFAFFGPFTTHVLKDIKFDCTKQEYFGVPVMQLMRVFHNENGSIAPEQRKWIMAYIHYHEWNDGHGINDPYKN